MGRTKTQNSLLAQGRQFKRRLVNKCRNDSNLHGLHCFQKNRQLSKMPRPMKNIVKCPFCGKPVLLHNVCIACISGLDIFGKKRGMPKPFRY